MKTLTNFQSSTAYLILLDVSKGGIWPEEMIEWARRQMNGEKRVGVQIIRDALKAECKSR